MNAATPITRLDLFKAFLKVGVIGFGGVAVFVRHVVVVERGWLSETEFAELFGVASTLPGANTVNFATLLGDRHGGVAGAVAAVCGLMGAPLVILMAIASLYARFSGLPDVRAGLIGAAAAAAGLVIGTALTLLRNLTQGVSTLVVVAGVLAASLAGWPIMVILAIAIPVSLIAVRIRWTRRV